MASRYWVGGTATWDGTAGTKWATTSGGAGGAAVPTAADDVFFDAASGAVTVTLATGQSCLTLDFTGFTGTFAHNSNVSLTVAGNLYRLVAGMTFSTTAAGTTARIDFTSTSGTCLITSAGKSLCSMTFNGVGGTFQLQDALTTLPTHTVTLTNGTLDTNAQACSWGLFVSANTNTRVLTITNSTINITCTTAATAWNVNNGAGGVATALTLNATGSLVRISGASGSNTITFAGGGKTYNNVEFNGPGRTSMSYSSTFANLTHIGTSDTYCRHTLAVNQTVTGTWTVTGFSSVVRPLIVGAGTSFEGIQRTITVGAVAFTNADFMSIVISGVTATGTRLGDALNNSGFTFDTPRTLYWTGGLGGSWSDVSKWSLSSGGAGGEAVPLPQDNVIFDANSITTSGQTVTADLIPLGLDVSFANVGVAPALALRSSGVLGNSLFGSITLKAGMTISGSDELYLRSTTSKTITSAGVSFAQNFIVVAPGGTYTLQDDLTTLTNRTFQLLYGTFNANGYNVTAGLMNSSGANTRTLTMGSGTWTVTGTGNVVNFTTMTGLTVTPGTSNIKITDTSASTKTIAHGSSLTLYDITITPGGAGAIIFGANPLVLHAINLNGGSKTLQFTAGAGSTTTVSAGGWNVNGISGSLVSLTSGTPGSPAFISIASGLVNSNYLSVTDSTAQGGAYFQAVNSTNGGGNTGWNFVTASAGGGLQAGKKFAAFGGARPINKVLDSKLHGYRKLGG